MTALNRTFVVLVALALFAGGMAFALVPGWPAIAGSLLSNTAGGEHIWIGLALAAIAALLLLLEFWPQRRVYESSIEGAVVEYPAASVREVAERELESIMGVRHAKAEVGSRRRGLDLRATLDTEVGFDAQDLSNRAAARLRERLERGLGLRVDRLRLAVRPGQSAPSMPWQRRQAPAPADGVAQPAEEEREREVSTRV